MGPVTTLSALAAPAIADLAFKKFIESGAGELGKQFTTTAIAKIDELRQTIGQKLRGQSEKLDQAFTLAEQGDSSAIATIAEDLGAVMQGDEAFARQVDLLVQAIQRDRITNTVTIGKQINVSQAGTGNTQTNTFSL